MVYGKHNPAVVHRRRHRRLGQSTQLALPHRLSAKDTSGVQRMEFPPLVESDPARQEKKSTLMTLSDPYTDFADRTEHQIVPPLKAGSMVLADRYIYTAFARDVARGVDRDWVRGLYAFAVKPTVAFYADRDATVANEKSRR
jgi:dTMP kinase